MAVTAEDSKWQHQELQEEEKELASTTNTPSAEPSQQNGHDYSYIRLSGYGQYYNYVLGLGHRSHRC